MGLNVWGAEVTIFDASDPGWTADGVDLTTGTTTVGDATWYGGGNAAIDKGGTVSGKIWSKRLKFGGKSTTQSDKTLVRVIKFSVVSAGTVKVYAVTGSSGKDRYVYVSQSLSTTTLDESVAKAKQNTNPASVATASVVAGDVYVWANDNIGIYGITFEASSGSPEDPTMAFDNGTYHLGASALDLKTLKGNTFVGDIGSVSFAVTDAGTTDARIDGTNFTATATGTATITATHAETAAYHTANTTFTITVTEAPKSDKCQLISAKYSNGFYGAIAEPASPANGVVEVRYLQGTAAPTLTSVEVSENATYVDNGSTIVVTAEDGTTTATYDVNIAAVAPLDVTADVATTTFTEVPAWIYNPYGYDETKGLKFAKKKNEESNMRIAKGFTRQYFFISAAQKLTLTSATQSRNIKVYKDGVELDSPTATGAANNTIEIALNPAAACMITIESNQTGGDGGFKAYAIKANPSAGSHNITYTNVKGADNSANPTSFEEGTGVANFTALADVTGYTFASWIPASIADDVTEDQTIEATWTPVQYAITYEGLEGATHSNPATYTIEDAEIVFSAPSARTGYTFTGWTPASIAAGSHENKTVTAGWAGEEPAADYKLISADVLDNTNFRHVTENLTDENYVVNGISYTKCMALGATNSAMIQLYAQNKFVAYDSKTDATNVDIVVYNKNSGSKKLTILIVPEGAELSACVPETIDVATKTGVVKSVAMTGRSTLYCSVNSTDVRFCQIRVNENGTALPAVGENGYSVNLNLGRLAAESGKSSYLDGIEYVVSTSAKVMNSTETKITTLGTHYVKFTLPAAAKLNVTTSNTSKYYVATAKDGKTYETTPTAGEATSFELTAGTWYINPAGSNVNITKISFAAPTPRYAVTFNTNGGSAVEAQSVLEGGKVTEPEDPTKADYDFIEWCADEELTTPFDFENTTISAATTIYAKWTAHVTSTDATLASLTVNGNDILDGDEVEYTIYADVLPTVVATKNNEFATVTPTEAAVIPGTSTYLVTAESGATKTYTIHFVATANACGTLINATLTSNTAATVTGVLGGTAVVNVQDLQKGEEGYKLGSNGHYIGLTPAVGSFRTGDVVVVNVTKSSAKLEVFSDKGTNMIASSDAVVVGDNRLAITEDASEIYLYRNSADMNPYVKSIRVERDCNPQITDFVVAGVHATINHSAETITAELPYGTSLASLTPSVTLGNGGTSYTPVGAQDFTSPVEYTVTGANGTRTYAVTLTVESHDPAMEITSTNGVIALSGLSPRTKNVTTTLSGEYLTAGIYDVTVSAVVEGLSIAPVQFTVAEDGSLAETEFTITYASDADVAEADVTFTFSDGTTSKVYTLTYRSEAKPAELPLLDVTGNMTWDFTNSRAVDEQVKGINDGQYYVLENYAVKPALNGQYIAADFNKITTDNLQGKGLKFHTNVPGTVTVEFSNTGSKNNYRVLYVNGEETTAKSKTTGHVTYTQFVLAGDVILTAFEETASWNMLNFYKVTFKPATEVRSGLTPGKIVTYCGSKNVIAHDGATFYYLSHKAADLSSIELTEVTGELHAGYPYIVIAEKSEINVVYGDEVENTAKDYNGLHGVLGETVTLVDGDYIIKNNKYYRAHTGNNNTAADGRAYLRLAEVSDEPVAVAPGESAPAPVSARRVIMGSSETTVATDINALDQNADAQKVLMDGVLYIIRAGKTYTPAGQLVK